MNDTPCIAVPGSDSIVDVCDPATLRTRIAGETLDEVRQRYPGAELTTIEAHCADKAARQDTPIAWREIDEERFTWMLECVPPAAMRGARFLVGEAYDHHALTGEARFHGYKQEGARYFETTRPITVREFRQGGF